MVSPRRRTLGAWLAPFGSDGKPCSSSDHRLHSLFRCGWEKSGHSFPYLLLLLFYVKSTINDCESFLFGHEFVLFDDSGMEHSVALENVVAQVQIHSCLVELQFGPADENAFHRNFDRYSEVEANVGGSGEVVCFPNPIRGTPSNNISGIGCVRVPVRENDVTSPQQRENISLVSISKVCGVEKAERGGCKQSLLFAFGRYFADDL